MISLKNFVWKIHEYKVNFFSFFNHFIIFFSQKIFNFFKFKLLLI